MCWEIASSLAHLWVCQCLVVSLAALPDAWHDGVSAVTCLSCVIVLWVSEVEKCDLEGLFQCCSMWNCLSKSIPEIHCAYCWDVKQPRKKKKNNNNKSIRAWSGLPGVGIPWLSLIASLICSFSVWQHAQFSQQICPWYTWACCWDVKQPATNQPTNPSCASHLDFSSPVVIVSYLSVAVLKCLHFCSMSVWHV